MARHDRRRTEWRATSRAQRRRARQGELFARTWGGPRLGSGRKRRAPREHVQHRTRERFRGARPVHVTLRLMAGLPSLRETAAYRALVAALGAGSERFGLRLIHWSALGNHVHLMVEARDLNALSRGMQGLGVRIARALNRLWRRKGKVFSDRYHAHVLNYPKEVRTALAYVLHNARKHRAIAAGLDAFSSAASFDDWLGRAPSVRTAVERPRWLLEARSWLLARGWRLGGLLAVEDSSREPRTGCNPRARRASLPRAGGLLRARGRGPLHASDQVARGEETRHGALHPRRPPPCRSTN